MFDRSLEKMICEFGSNYYTPEHKFKSCVAITTDRENNIVCMARVNGREKTFLTLTEDEYAKRIRNPVRASRVGTNYGNRFFLWHWLEETKQTHLFFNSLKELTNA